MTLNELINLSVTRLGFNKVSLPEFRATKQGEMALDNYPQVAKTMLRRANWPEAIKRVTLDYEPGYPDNNTGFAYQYKVPSDLLKVLNLNDDNDEAFRNESTLLYCDAEAPVLSYIADISIQYDSAGVIDYTEDLLYSTSLGEAIIWELANQMSMGLKINRALMERAEKYAIIAYYEALSQSGTESREEQAGIALWVDA